MRYLIAMVTAVLCAAIATLWISSPVASWIVRQYEFDTPDTVAQLHAAAFMVTNVVALVFGFLAGWVAGRPWRET